MHPFISLQNLRLAEDFFLKCKWFYTLAIVVNKSFQNPKKKTGFFFISRAKSNKPKKNRNKNREKWKAHLYALLVPLSPHTSTSRIINSKYRKLASISSSAATYPIASSKLICMIQCL